MLFKRPCLNQSTPRQKRKCSCTERSLTDSNNFVKILQVMGVGMGVGGGGEWEGEGGSVEQWDGDGERRRATPYPPPKKKKSKNLWPSASNTVTHTTENSTHKGVDQHLKGTTQAKQQRPELPTVTLTRHESKCKAHKLHQRPINSMRCTSRKLTGTSGSGGLTIGGCHQPPWRRAPCHQHPGAEGACSRGPPTGVCGQKTSVSGLYSLAVLRQRVLGQQAKYRTIMSVQLGSSNRCLCTENFSQQPLLSGCVGVSVYRELQSTAFTLWLCGGCLYTENFPQQPLLSGCVGAKGFGKTS